MLVAVSGGADSVALLRVLLELRGELGIVPSVGHFNHGLRGEESEADEHFVEQLARRHALDFFVERADVAEYAAGERMGLESAGRELRYKWLTRVAVDGRFNVVTTAHTLDDQAETVLMKFLRGAGSRGLAGIYPLMVRSEGPRFIRPLLSTTRTEIEMYLESIGQDWREDETNLDRRFLRNRVRHELLPLLDRDYNPSIREVLSGRAEISRAEEEYWDGVVNPLLKVVVTERRRLRLHEFSELAVAVQRRVLKRFLEEQNIACDSQHVEALRQCALGELPGLELPGNWVARRSKDYLTLQPQQDNGAEGRLFVCAFSAGRNCGGRDRLHASGGAGPGIVCRRSRSGNAAAS